MWIVRNKVWGGNIRLFVNRPTRNLLGGYWEDLSFPDDYDNYNRRYGYTIPEKDGPTYMLWKNEPIEVCFKCISGEFNGATYISRKRENQKSN